ncbi:hypothetical protein [Snodgrassella sp. CS2]|uniref:hypothetical protein n=1 Tax=Snodgrassella sp. CS2 TaxID=3418953 RepID=UPI003D0058C0
MPLARSNSFLKASQLIDIGLTTLTPSTTTSGNVVRYLAGFTTINLVIFPDKPLAFGS